MYIKFDLSNKKIFGRIIQINENRIAYKDATINIDVNDVVKMEVTHMYDDVKNTDIVELTSDGIKIPFKKNNINVGVNRFVLTAFMKDGHIKTSQTCIHEVSEEIYDNLNTSSFRTIEFTELTIGDIRVYPIVVDMDSVDPIETPIKFKQYDFGSSHIVMQLIDNDIPLKLNDVSIVATYKNAINNVLLDTATYNASESLVSGIDGVVKLLVPDDAMRYAGKVECEVMIFNAEHKRSTTPNIKFEIVKSIANHEDDNEIVNDDRYSILTTLINNIGTIYTRVEELITSTELVKNETTKVKNDTVIVKDQANAKIIDVENRMTEIENTFGSLVDGTGFATVPFVTEQISTVTGEINKKANSADVYTKNETDTKVNLKANSADVYTKSQTDDLINSKTQINDNATSTTSVWSSKKTSDAISVKANSADVYTKSQTDDLINSKTQINDDVTNTETVWSSKKTYDEIQAVADQIAGNVSDTINVPLSDWVVDGDMYKVNVTHSLKTDKVVPLAFDVDKTSLFVGSKILDINTIEFKSNEPVVMTVLVINGGVPIDAVGVTINDDVAGTTQTWSSKKIQSEVGKVDTKVVEIQNELKESVNTKYTTVNGTKTFESKDGYIDNLYIPGETLVNAKIPGTCVWTASENRLNIVNGSHKLVESNTQYTFFNLSDKIITINGLIPPSSWQAEMAFAPNSATVFTLGANQQLGVMCGYGVYGWTTNDVDKFNTSIVILKGDHTSRKISYFERMCSVGQGDVIEINNRSGYTIYTQENNFTYNNSTSKDLWVNHAGIEINSSVVSSVYNITITDDAYYKLEVSDSNAVDIQILKDDYRTYASENKVSLLTKGKYIIRYKCKMNNVTSVGFVKLVKIENYVYNKLSVTGRSLPSGVKDEIIQQGNKYYKIVRCAEYTNYECNYFGQTSDGSNIYQYEITVPTNARQVISNVLPSKGNVANSTIFLHPNSNTTLVLRFKDMGITTQEQAKQFLINNNFTYVVELYTPQIIEIPNPNIRTFEGQNTFMVNSGPVQSEVNFEVTNSLSDMIDVMSSKIASLDEFINGDSVIYTPTLLNGWTVRYEGVLPLRVIRTGNIVTIDGSLLQGVIASNTLIFTIPQKFRPNTNIFVPVFERHYNKMLGYICINSEGKVIIQDGTFVESLTQGFALSVSYTVI